MFAWAGIDLSSAVGAILVSLPTIVVVLHARLLRRVNLQLDPVVPPEASGPPLQAVRSPTA